MFEYIDVHNILHHLDDDVANNEYEIQHLEHIYCAKAVQLCREQKKSVFYCLKLFDSKKPQIIQGNYFLIPIEQEDIDRIAEQFGDKCYIGIVHKGMYVAN